MKLLKCLEIRLKTSIRYLNYIQGQKIEPNNREYFYYINHQGMLFLDDTKVKNFTSCFKDKKFLRFFFHQLKKNETNRYNEFPYLSICGKERNFVRCDDCPIVFTHILTKFTRENINETHLAYNNAGDLLTFKFKPEMLFMSPNTGRIYHPAPERFGSIGLVRSKLAIELSDLFTFSHNHLNPTHITFNGEKHPLDTTWYSQAISEKII